MAEGGRCGRGRKSVGQSAGRGEGFFRRGLSRSLIAAMLLTPSISAAQGVSARFLAIHAVEGQPLEVPIELDDPTGAASIVEVELSVDGGRPWHQVRAERGRDGHTWRARFDGALIPAAGSTIELRAAILGARGGLLLDLGHDAPFRIEVSTAARAAARTRLLTRRGREDDLGLIGYVGAEGRAGSSARARMTLGAGITAGDRREIVLGISVGPAFSRPRLLETGGPMVLGFEAAYRTYTLDPEYVRLAPFFEVMLGADARLPGFDPALGARAGLSIGLGADTRADLALGGAAVIYGAIGDPEPTLGFMGGLRVALRLGSPKGEDPER